MLKLPILLLQPSNPPLEPNHRLLHRSLLPELLLDLFKQKFILVFEVLIFKQESRLNHIEVLPVILLLPILPLLVTLSVGLRLSHAGVPVVPARARLPTVDDANILLESVLGRLDLRVLGELFDDGELEVLGVGARLLEGQVHNSIREANKSYSVARIGQYRSPTLPTLKTSIWQLQIRTNPNNCNNQQCTIPWFICSSLSPFVLNRLSRFKIHLRCIVTEPHLYNYDIITALINSINLSQYKMINESQSLTSPPSISEILKQKYSIYLKNRQLIEQLFLLEEKEILIPYTYLWQLGGKKVRVIAALLISDLFNRQAKDEVLKIGGLIEMLHCASLIIDDIEDGSVMRRGQPCSHKVYGVDSAINAANLIYFLPISKLLEEVVDSEKRWKLNQIYLKQMMWCHVGQGLDIKYHKAEKKQDLPSLEEYIKIVSMKTAGLMKMLVKMLGVSMEIDTQSVQILTECMSNVGIAFQIIDDLLNVTSTQECMGKGVIAEDLHEKKFTIIIHKLKEDDEFLSLFFQKQKEEATISRLLTIIKQSGVLLECKQQAQKYIDKAIECLQKLQCPGSKSAFREFIKFIVERKS